MSDSVKDVLGHRLDEGIAVFAGCTFGELTVLAVLCFLPVALLCTVLSLLTVHMLTAGLGVAVIITFWVTKSVARRYERFKGDKPRGYVKQRVALGLQSKGLYQSPLIHKSSAWEVGHP